MSDLAKLEDASPAHVLRIEQARLVLAQRRGDVSAASKAGLASASLIDLVGDPLARTGFLHALCTTLRLAAYYDDAMRIAHLELEEAKRSRLKFVVPHGYSDLGAAKGGQGDYAAAIADIDRARDYDVGVDHYFFANCAAIKARVLLSRGHVEAARDAVDLELLPELRSDMRGEVYATRALIFACLGDFERSTFFAEKTADFADLVDTEVLRAVARAAIEVLDERAHVDESFDLLTDVVLRTGNYDGVICAFRSAPSIARAAANHPRARALLETAAKRTRDPVLAATVGLTVPPRHAFSPSPLSRRETEVLSLAAEGFTNAAIGGRLFISDKTVKTHLRNVYKKLSVGSRTEAVVRAKEAGYLR